MQASLKLYSRAIVYSLITHTLFVHAALTFINDTFYDDFKIQNIDGYGWEGSGSLLLNSTATMSPAHGKYFDNTKFEIKQEFECRYVSSYVLISYTFEWCSLEGDEPLYIKFAGQVVQQIFIDPTDVKTYSNCAEGRKREHRQYEMVFDDLTARTFWFNLIADLNDIDDTVYIGDIVIHCSMQYTTIPAHTAWDDDYQFVSLNNDGWFVSNDNYQTLPNVSSIYDQRTGTSLTYNGPYIAGTSHVTMVRYFQCSRWSVVTVRSRLLWSCATDTSDWMKVYYNGKEMAKYEATGADVLELSTGSILAADCKDDNTDNRFAFVSDLQAISTGQQVFKHTPFKLHLRFEAGGNTPERLGVTGISVECVPVPTNSPTEEPTAPSSDPTNAPSVAPTYSPSSAPSYSPSVAPTAAPTEQTLSPTATPSYSPTLAPSNTPSQPPTSAPSLAPSVAPSNTPSQPPTAAPSIAPSNAPSNAPSQAPTLAPSLSPSQAPSNAPSQAPTLAPSLAPSQAPSNAPSNAPTLAPSSAPSLAPTLAPSNAPTLAPSSAPSLAPTLAPSNAPTLAPSNAPTHAPSIAPTDSPTPAPSNTPSQPPTAAPSLAPSIAPSVAPSDSPSGAPSNAPSLAPSFSPSVAPSDAPSYSPTSAPSESPTQAPTQIDESTQVELLLYYNVSLSLQDIILSEFNRKLARAAMLGLQHGTYGGDPEQYKFIHDVYICVSFSVVSYDANSPRWHKSFDCEKPKNYREELSKPQKEKKAEYKPATKAAQYLAVVKILVSGDTDPDSKNKTIELQRLLTVDASDLEPDVDINSTRRRLKEADMRDIQKQFKNIAEQCMVSSDIIATLYKTNCTGFLGLDETLDSFEIISLDAAFVTEIVPPEKSLIAKYIVDILRYFIYVFVACCLLAAIVGKMDAKKRKADNVKPWGILWFSLYTWDFYSDLLFDVRLAEYSINDEKHADIVWILFAASSVFIFIPWLLNLVQLLRAQKKWMTDSSVQEGVRGWFVDWSIVLVCAVALSGSSFGAVELANSNLFGSELFSMGLSKKHLKAFQGKRFFSSVLFENFPQLAVQIYFLILLGGFDESTFIALLSSGVSMILSVVDIWSARHISRMMKKQAKNGNNMISVQFYIDTHNQSFDEIGENKHNFISKPNALAKAIAETLVVHRRNIEIYQLIASSPGIKVGFTVYTVDGGDTQESIATLRRELKQLQLLISIYWKMKTYPNIRHIQEGLRKKPSTINIDPDVIGLPPPVSAVASNSAVSLLRVPGGGGGKHTLAISVSGQAYNMQTFEATPASPVSPTSTTYAPDAARKLVYHQQMNSMVRGELKSTDPQHNEHYHEKKKEEQKDETLSFDANKLVRQFLAFGQEQTDFVAMEDDGDLDKYVRNMETLIARTNMQQNDGENEEEIAGAVASKELETWLLSIENMKILLSMRDKLKASANAEPDVVPEESMEERLVIEISQYENGQNERTEIVGELMSMMESSYSTRL